jgi:hypothetical protein
MAALAAKQKSGIRILQLNTQHSVSICFRKGLPKLWAADERFSASSLSTHADRNPATMMRDDDGKRSRSSPEMPLAKTPRRTTIEKVEVSTRNA